MTIQFTKLQGNGNDFILIDEWDDLLVPDDRKAAFAKKYCHRRFGIGADGVLFLTKGVKAPLQMRIFNEDGSEAEMCGNGIRCFAKYALDKRYIVPGLARVETKAGVLEIETKTENGKTYIKVNMGKPLFDRVKIPAQGHGEFINVPLHGYEVSAVNTGVPHAVVFVDSLEDPDLMDAAPLIRFDKVFAKGANVNFVQRDMGNLRVRTYERGVEGETLSCGTGSVAAAAIARHLGIVRDSAVVKTAGGELRITFEHDMAYMEGGAETVYKGEIEFDLSTP
ncbi:diaminopimelate epimerase [Methanocella paludicola SANAE]|uniref:Diaminopimelate epimerase n=1 Tax=Methanocella paludicola (strain DSM 17711 / JCM 13418 / NBRC 101707 / SANAE) TaxID=304371 RepID=D1YWV8_METPS|nr:diaminopimelate epimerase [Methanocella paludicola]BAI60930.1 diaminopimelate epimerase [Methanocella paludicola SANAE]